MALRTGYGTGTFSAAKYGLPQVYEGAVSASLTFGATSVAQRIQNGVATDSVTSAATSAAIRIQNGVVGVNITMSETAIGYTTIVGAVADVITSAVDLYWNRVRPFAVSDNAILGTSVISRYKWLAASNPTTSWTEADYLERAA